jgi:fructokinase
MPVFGGIEAGGTKFLCGTGTCPDDLTVVAFPTELPDVTIKKAVQFFRGQIERTLSGIGVGSFGPIDRDPASATYGRITSTPKPEWKNFDFVGALTRTLHLPVTFDTDVNAAALAEGRWGAARDVQNFIYVTVGTGIGGGLVVNGSLVHGLMHPEMGHIRLPHDFQQDPFLGDCPFHKDCLEGLASGAAMKNRWGRPAKDLPPEHPAWTLEADYLALALHTWVCTLSPQRIIMGGGVMQNPSLFLMIRERLKALLNGYIPLREVTEQIDEYVVPPHLGGHSGVLGAMLLAKEAHTASNPALMRG